MNDTPFLGIRVVTLGMAAIVVLAIGLVHVLVRWYVHRKTKAFGTEAPIEPSGPLNSRQLLRRATAAAQDLAGPLLFLVWVHGLSFALSLIVADVSNLAMAARATAAVQWVAGLLTMVALVWGLARIGRLIERVLNSFAARSETAWDDFVLPLAGRAARTLLPLVAVILGAPALTVSPALAIIVSNATSLVLIGGIAFVLVQTVNTGTTLLLQRYRVDVSDNLRARSIHTQVLVVKKAITVVIVVFTVASMLMVFDSVRQFGASILASAGIAGIVVGLAAQRSIGTLLAGFQVAFTQPIRVDDVVIVEGEFGNVEEITLTYVVVRVWDLRRIVLPITYFIEKPFQNWSRVSTELLGAVMLYVDYSVPLEPIREELTRLLKASSRWDGNVNVLQVTDCKQHTLELRALMSATNAAIAWDLRCEVREGLIAFIQREYPESLPRFRASVVDETTAQSQGSVGAGGSAPTVPTVPIARS